MTPKMMPGQTPYTPEDVARLEQLVSDAAAGDPGELEESKVMTAEQTMRELCKAKAAEMWAAFTKNEKTAVRFGMFPAGPMQAADKEGFDGRLLSVALMDCATADGGMKA